MVAVIFGHCDIVLVNKCLLIEWRWLGRGRISNVEGEKFGEALERFSILGNGIITNTSPISFWCGAV